MNELPVPDPSLSVILPTHNRCWTLGRQLDCILPQLLPGDEVIVLPNGCVDRTEGVIRLFENIRLNVITSRLALGVCGGYNKAAVYARGDWILGANDHNELSPGAIGAWRAWAKQYPDARVMFGHVDAMQRMGWRDGGGWIDVNNLPMIWLADKGSTHGAATFIRRDSWGVGYRPELEWMADYEQSLTLTMRFGCVDIPELISHVECRPGNYSQAHGIPARRNKVIRAWRALIETDEFADVRSSYMLMHQIRGFFNEV